jgi:hypothetical protein
MPVVPRVGFPIPPTPSSEKESSVMGCIVCVMCEALTDDWVVWGAAYVEEVFYFCDNDCLAQWLVRLKTEA